jgi:hypothetical protein
VEYVVAFGTCSPESFATSWLAHRYLDEKFRRHKHACFSVDGPAGTWATFCHRDLWLCTCEDADAFDAYYRMAAVE